MSENESSLEELFKVVENSDEDEKRVLIQKRISREQELAKLELIRFTRNRMSKSDSINQIVDKASKILIDRLDQDEVELANISTGTLTYIIEKLSKVEVDLLGAMLSANKSTPSINLNIGDKPSGGTEAPKKPEVPIDKDQFERARKVLDFLDKIEDIKNSGEFKKDEIEVEVTSSNEP